MCYSFNIRSLILRLSKLLDLRHNGSSNFLCSRLTTKILRQNPRSSHILDALHERGRRILFAQPSKHLSCRPERSDGVSDALAGDVKC